jgi:hypothetical protein
MWPVLASIFDASNRDAVDENVDEAFGVLMGIDEVGFVDDAGGVEDRDIGFHPRAEQTAVHDAKPGGGEAGHAADSLLETLITTRSRT